MIISTPPENPADPADETADPDTDASELRDWVVDAGGHGERLDKLLAARVPEFSRSYLQQLVGAGAVQVNERVASKPAARMRAGDRLRVEMRPTAESRAFLPEPMALDLRFEDEHLLVLNKPAGLVVHPAAGHWSGTLLNGLLARDASAAVLPRAGIVHRLDKDTSGLMVVARSRVAMGALVRQIAARTVRRQYLALAHGAWRGAAPREVDAAIGRDPRNRLRMAVVDLQQGHGKTARTRFELLQNSEQFCLLQCTLQTGRTHQIRVHAAHLGHPLLADTLYGGRAEAGLTRQALHAWRLAFEHPVSGAPLAFLCDPPDDLRAVLARLGLDYNPAQTDRV